MPKWEAFKGKEVFGEAKDERGKPKAGITKRSGIVYFEGYWGSNQNGNHMSRPPAAFSAASISLSRRSARMRISAAVTVQSPPKI